MRLDSFIAKELNESRSQVQALIKKGFVKVDSKIVDRVSYSLKVAQNIEIEFPKVEKKIDGERVAFKVEKIYEDEDILVIDKPSGVVVHKAPSYKKATLVDWLQEVGISLSTLAGEERRGIVHRLDKETSGLMVVAKNNASHKILSQNLKNKEIGRIYISLIDLPLKESKIVEKPLARNPKNRLKIGVVEGGRASKSAFLKLVESNGVELIAAKLFTGRTHQIRAHLESLNRHILGDSLYGFKSTKSIIPRVFLHSKILYLVHPRSGELLTFTSSIPSDMIEFMIKNDFNMEKIYEKTNHTALLSEFNSTF